MKSTCSMTFGEAAVKVRVHFCVSACFAVALTCGNVTVVRAATISNWNSLGGGTFNWDSNTNPPWDTAVFPNGVGDEARLNQQFAQVTTINLNQSVNPITLGIMRIGDTNNTRRAITIGNGTGTLGFRFDNTGVGNSVLEKVSDSQPVTINPDITIAGNGNLDLNVVSGPLNLNGKLTIPANGSLNFTSSSSTVILSGALIGDTTSTLNFSGSGNIVGINGDVSGFKGTYNIVVGSSTITFQGLTAASQDGSQAKFNITGSTTGTFRWSDNATPAGINFKMGELSGNAYLRNEGGHPITVQIGFLNTDSTFTGIIGNGGQPPTFPGSSSEPASLEKVGMGILSLGGADTYQGTTTVTAGTLRVNGTHEGGAAYTVASGGALGGTGTINSSTGGANNFNLNAGVTVQAGGKLAPGASAGVLHMNLGTGVLDISGAVAASNSQSMQFELDTPSASDQVQLLGTTNLNIGSGTLEFNDFAFSPLGGFANNTYTLFESSTPITGSLGSNLSGSIGAYFGTLSLADGGNDVVLTVVPEPSSLLLIAFGLIRCGGITFRRSPKSREV